MQARLAISNEQWVRIAPAIAGATSRGPKGRDDRAFFEALLWILRTGAPWRDLPGAFGKWSRSYRRFRRWALAGRWETLRRLKVFRRVATRYEQTLLSYAGWVAAAAFVVALSGWRA